MPQIVPRCSRGSETEEKQNCGHEHFHNPPSKGLEPPTDPSRPYFFCLENFVPSSDRLYINPFCPKTNATIGSFMFCVSMVPPAPSVTRETEPSTPAYQPSL